MGTYSLQMGLFSLRKGEVLILGLGQGKSKITLGENLRRNRICNVALNYLPCPIFISSWGSFNISPQTLLYASLQEVDSVLSLMCGLSDSIF